MSMEPEQTAMEQEVPVQPEPVKQGNIPDRSWEILNRIADAPSLNPDKPRKPREERMADLVRWLKKYHYINGSYNEYGMDIVGFDQWDEYVDHYSGHLEAFQNRQFYRLKGSIIPRPLNAVLSDDKYAFYAFMETICPGSTPKVVLYVQRGGKVGVAPGVFMDAETAIRKLPDGKYVCKPTLGQCGRNVIIITVKGVQFTLNGGITWDDVMAAFRKEPHIIQEFIVQHEAMARLNPPSVNTIRIITTKFNAGAHLFSAMVRMGVNDAPVDNAAAGGTFVGVDLEKGCMMKYGLYHNKPSETQHPATGVVYEGYELPYWKEAVELVKYLHLHFLGFPTMGWDVAITNNGPVVIENNYDWGFDMSQHIYGGLRKRWDAAKKLP